MSRSGLLLVTACSVGSLAALVPETAHATKRADAIRRCNNQLGCKVIRERNGDVVIIVDDVDGDGQGGGVIHCPAGTGNCSPMRKKPTQPKVPHVKDPAISR